MKGLVRERILVFAFAASVLAPGGFAGLALGAQAPQIQPPAPPNLYTSLSEAELIAQLPDHLRTVIESRRDPRDRYEALLDASDTLLGALTSRLTAREGSIIPGLQLSEAVLMTADRRLRSPEANVRPRDRMFKRYERRLSHQLSQLKALLVELTHDEIETGAVVADRVTRLRVGALNSALDIESNILRVPEEKP
jgi:hypothetical protein